LLSTTAAVSNRLNDSGIPGEYDANNRLLRSGDATYDYDANGNLATKVQGSDLTRFFCLTGGEPEGSVA
jgi:hypothetical protein